jgi:hypothetical protein
MGLPRPRVALTRSRKGLGRGWARWGSLAPSRADALLWGLGRGWTVGRRGVLGWRCAALLFVSRHCGPG